MAMKTPSVFKDARKRLGVSEFRFNFQRQPLPDRSCRMPESPLRKSYAPRLKGNFFGEL
jgi:hypothetical protein